MGFLYTGLAAGVTTPHPSHSTPQSKVCLHSLCSTGTTACESEGSRPFAPSISYSCKRDPVAEQAVLPDGMVVGFAELGGTIGLFPSAMPWGLRLTLELRLVFEPKILLFQPPAHWRLRLLLSLRGLLWLNHKALLLHMQMK